MGSGILVLNQPGVYLVDADGNTITLSDAGTIGDAEGIIIMGKDGTVARMLALDSSGNLAVLPLPTGAATQATLLAADTKLGTIDAVLDSIKDTAGIKKITDQLPAGVNLIGKATVQSGAKGTSAAADITSTPFDANTEALHVDSIDSRLLRERDQIVLANFAKEGVSATTYYVLVDLDGVPYAHDEAGTRLVMAGAAAQGFKSNIGAKWAVQIGIVMTIDGTDAKVGWLPIASLSLRDTSQFSGGQHLPLFPDYVDLSQTGGVFDKIASNLYESGITAVNTGVTLEDALGNSVTPAVGDMIMRAELVLGAGTLDFKYAVQYWAE